MDRSEEEEQVTEGGLRRLATWSVLVIAAVFVFLWIAQLSFDSPSKPEPAGPSLVDSTAPMLVDDSIRIGSSRDRPPLEVGCGRLDSDQSPFVLQMSNPPPDVNRLGAEVSLHRIDGSRTSSIVDLGRSLTQEMSRFELVSNSNADDFTRCSIVAIQIDTRLVRTGR